MTSKLLSAGLSTICIAVLAGCAHVGITAYAQPEPSPGKRFVLQGPDPRYPGGDPTWPVYSQVLTKALEAKGFVPVASSPDLIIQVSYGMGDTRTSTSTTSTPTMGYTTSTQTVVTPNPNPSGPPIVSTVSTPVWGVVGSTESTNTSSTTLSTIRIEALDAASYAAGKPTVVWSTHARSRAPIDLSQLFPYMVAAMEDYFGAIVPKEIDVTKDYNDPEVTRLRETLEHFPNAPTGR
jgi:Domain of unknown function (DUF4136)